MEELEIKQKLDRLAEYQAQRDLMEIDKRALLEDVKVPDEIQAVVNSGMKKMSEVDGSFSEARKALQEEIVGIEMEEKYCFIARERTKYWENKGVQLELLK